MMRQMLFTLKIFFIYLVSGVFVFFTIKAMVLLMFVGVHAQFFSQKTIRECIYLGLIIGFAAIFATWIFNYKNILNNK